MTLRILVVDDHEIMREGMCALLRKHPDLEVVGQAAEGRTAMEMAKELRPDVVIMDVNMPNLNGIEATRQIISSNPNIKILALSAHSDGISVAKMIKAGAKGYMLKESAFIELIDGLNAIREDRTYLCSKISYLMFTEYVNMLTESEEADPFNLTQREREILQLVAEGHSSKSISKTLHLSSKTVDSHREKIMKKLNIHNIADLTKYAIRERLTTT